MKIKKIKVNEIVGTAVTVLIAVLILFPLIWLLVSSFKSDADVIKWPPIFFPTQWLTAQYKYVVDAIHAEKYSCFFSRSNCSQSVF